MQAKKELLLKQRSNVLTGDGSLLFSSLRPINLTNCTKQDLKDYLNNSFDLYESLFKSIKHDYAYYLCPDKLRLPLIFYYGHTTSVYINKLTLSGLIQPSERVNLDMETTFETGVDEMSWDDTEHYRMGGDYKWPTVEETRNYRQKVRELILKVIDRTELKLPITWDSPWWALLMGFEHDRIHLETSSVLIRQYPVEYVEKPDGWKYGPFVNESGSKATLTNPMIRVEGKKVRLGKPYEYPSYGWDNEYGFVDCRVSTFEASKFKVTNEEFYEFVKSKGYETREYWSEEGWKWVTFKNAKHPLFWVCPCYCKSGCGGELATYTHCKEIYFEQDALNSFKNLDINNNNSSSDHIPYKFRLMFDVVDMPKNWPVEVNYHEAKAFCKWKGEDYRILTEAEHHAIRDKDLDEIKSPQDELIFNFDEKNPKANHNYAFGSSTPVDYFEANKKGFHDVFGNVWEWVEDNFNGLPGGKTHYLYDDFSTPCYDGRHNLIMGGSWISTGDEASDFSRFMFRRHFYQHCGFRLSRSIKDSDELPDPQVRLVQDRVFVLGFGIPNNPHTLDEKKVKVHYYPTTNDQYFLDSHLYPNAVSEEKNFDYELDKSVLWFDEFMKQVKENMEKFNAKRNLVTIIGSSTGRLAFELTNMFTRVIGVDFCGRFLDFSMKLIDNNMASDEIQLKAENYTNLKMIEFKQMTWIPNEIPVNDLVLFTMIDRVTNKLTWLKRFREVVAKNGLLIIFSKHSKQNSKQLGEILANDFVLVDELKITNTKQDTFTVWKKT